MLLMRKASALVQACLVVLAAAFIPGTAAATEYTPQTTTVTIISQSNLSSGTNTDGDVLHFADIGLENAVRDTIGKTSGDILKSDVAGLTELDAGKRGIASIEGIQNLAGLKTLWLYDNSISDITPLQGLTGLETLGLCNNQVRDAGPVSGMTNLTFLSLYYNKVSDISALQNLTKLTTLKLAGNPIADYSPVAGVYDQLTTKDFDMNGSSVEQPAVIDSVASNDGPSIMLDGAAISFEVPPTVVSQRVMVPMRTIFEKLGAVMQWDGETQTVTATRGNTVIVLTLGSAGAYVNQVPVTLEVPAMAINEHTMVPLRFVSEALDCQVDWKAASQTAVINTGSAPVVEETVVDDTAVEETAVPEVREFKEEGSTCNFYINGKVVAHYEVGTNGRPSGQWIYGNGWTLWLTWGSVASTPNSFDPYSPFPQTYNTITTETRLHDLYLDTDAGEVHYDPNQDEWRQDPYIISHHIASAIDYVLDYLEENDSV